MKIVTPEIYFRVGGVSREERRYQDTPSGYTKDQQSRSKVAYLPSPDSVPKEPPRQWG